MGGESTSRSSSRRRLRGPTFARTPVQEHIVTPSGSGVRTRCTAPDDRYSFIYNPYDSLAQVTRATLYIYVYARMDWNKDVVHLCTFKFSWDGRRGGREGVIRGSRRDRRIVLYSDRIYIYAIGTVSTTFF